MLTVGLTGMSGAGKSYVASRLSECGFNIIDADAVYHGLVSCDSECLREIELTFGCDVITPQRTLDRPALSRIVFSDPEKLAQLNLVTHKHVLLAIRQMISDLGGICVVDAPQLFESGFDAECDLIISVVAERDVCIKRITERDGITCERAKARLDSQHDSAFFRAKSDIVIENNGNDISKDIENTIKLIKEKNNG